MISLDDLPFLDVGWVAVDAEGWPAIFFSGGGGFVPPTARPAFLAEYDVEAEVLGLPAFSDARGRERAHDEVFVGFAERGFFVFDCRAPHQGDVVRQRCYHRACVPTHPRAIASLPSELQAVARATVLAGVRFATQEQIVFDV